MNPVLIHWLGLFTQHANFHAVRKLAVYQPLGRSLFFADHGLHSLANFVPENPPQMLTANTLIHLWFTVEYVRLRTSTSIRTIDWYDLDDLWLTILHEQKPALATATHIYKFVSTGIGQYKPQHQYDDKLIAHIASTLSTRFAQPYKHVMLYPPPPPPKVRPAPVFRSREDWRYEEETDMYGRTKYDRAMEQLDDAEQQNRADLEEHKHEFREIDESTRYNDTDSWQNPWGDRD
jgi:hypothetical protein